MFAVGLTFCVLAGGAVGIMLAGNADRDNAEDARRVAALALDMRGLNGDALALSRSIEEAIAREELESDADALRSELTLVEERAARVRALAREQAAGRGATDLVSEDSGRVDGRARRAVEEIEATLAVFEREVVARLGSVLDSSPSPEAGSTDEALTEVTRVLARQDQALAELTVKLAESEATSGSADAGGLGRVGTDSTSGDFQVIAVPPGDPLDVDYEIRDLEAEADTTGVEPGEAMIIGSASGGLTVANTASQGYVSFASPAFHAVLYWEESEVPTAARDGMSRENPPEDGSEDLAGGSTGEVDGGERGPEGGEPCQYEFRGERYCALVRFALGDEDWIEETSMDNALTTLGPEETVGIDTLEPEGGLIVEARRAGVVTDFVESSQPDLVQIIVVNGSDLRPACVTPPPGEEEEGAVEESEVDGFTVGLLTGDGTVIFEAERQGESVRGDADEDPEAPECYTIKG